MKLTIRRLVLGLALMAVPAALAAEPPTARKDTAPASVAPAADAPTAARATEDPLATLESWLAPKEQFDFCIPECFETSDCAYVCNPCNDPQPPYPYRCQTWQQCPTCDCVCGHP